ncbi:MAG: S9 family peptidase [Actinomycetota bacterium]|nr:S9 family peptidase [Actinomycetota bacterium]
MSAETDPPLASRRPHVHRAHGHERGDDWYWLADREDPEVLAHLQAENAHAKAVGAPTDALQEKLFAEMRSRIVESDVTAPSRHGDYWYWSRTIEGQQYSIYYRQEDRDRRWTAKQVLGHAEADPDGYGQVILDENRLADGQGFFALGIFDLSPDHRLLAYAVDLDGAEKYYLRWRDLTAGTDLNDAIPEVYYGSAWAEDNATFFYVRPDDAMRPWQVWRHAIGSPSGDDVLVYQEDDERFFVSLGATRSQKYILILAESKTTSEALWIDAAAPHEPAQVVMARTAGVEYDLDHGIHPHLGDAWLIRTNRQGVDGTPAPEFAVYLLSTGSHEPAELVPLVAHRPEVKIEAVDAFADHVVITERAAGIESFRVVRWRDGDEHVIDQPDPVYSFTGGLNAEFATATYRFGYTSLVTPLSSVDYHFDDRRREVVKTQPVRGGYDPEAYQTQRIWATAPDGTRIPISLVARKDQPLDGSAPCLLYGYGAYELTVEPTFSYLRLNLLARGFVFAIAHVRGGGEMGRTWYEQGKLGHKTNTFTDFIACAEHLITTGWTSPARLVIRGASAGGLLMGAVTNMRPDLWRAVIAEVPFVDVVTTMSDPSLPLTVTEWEEWGNPLEDQTAYRGMLSYSPYDNVTAQDYPALYVTAGLNDPRVGYWEPAKWVALVRDRRTNDQPIVLRTEMGAGHQGPSGRYDAWRDEAGVQAFILDQVGMV